MLVLVFVGTVVVLNSAGVGCGAGGAVGFVVVFLESVVGVVFARVDERTTWASQASAGTVCSPCCTQFSDFGLKSFG